MPRYIYEGNKRKEIVFPLGGIGAGSIGLDGTGRLRDWEIYNRPSKGSYNGYSHFALKAERDGKVLDARVLNADLMPPYTGRQIPNARFQEYGYGPSRYLMTGVPHMRDSVFTGCFPECEVAFSDECFPGEVALSAFSPFIPLDDKNSSLPAAFFTIRVKNNTDAPIEYTGALSLNNPFKDAQLNTLIELDDADGMFLTGGTQDENDPAYGQLAMACTGGSLSYQQSWYRGGWFDNLSVFWQDFTKPGPLKNRTYPTGTTQNWHTREDIATLALCASVAPGEEHAFRFLISWYYPNQINDWSPDRKDEYVHRIWRNHYAAWFEDASDVAAYCMARWDELACRTHRFVEALQSSTVPDEALEAATSNLAVLKSPTVLRLEDGEFYGWEGVHSSSGSCEGSCQHVWNYQFALPFLFPSLERSMREMDYTYNLKDSGSMPFRLQLPLGSPPQNFRACVDGQMGGVIKSYREWKISGDIEWLKLWWPKIKRTLEFAWSPENIDLWDPEKSGVITGRQHHTLDMELFGPNAWLNGFYLAALKAAAEMGDAVGDADASVYRSLYENGRAYTDNELFNGEYYIQKLDIRDKSMLEAYSAGDTLFGADTVETYWNSEAGQIKYQIGEGCGIDQVLAQWMADQCGLGDILDPDHVKSALSAIYRHNFKQSMRFHFNPCRIYCLNDEAGLLICDWPEGHEKPVVPVPYAEETMHGFEYQAACHMIGRGLIDEGLAVVRSVRDRYDGEKRNPWNEFECGSNYARSMASWALMNTFAGFTVDMSQNALRFCPIEHRPEHRHFYSIDGAWGTYAQCKDGISLGVCEGALTLRRLSVPNAEAISAASIDGQPVAFQHSNGTLIFNDPVTIKAGGALLLK